MKLKKKNIWVVTLPLVLILFLGGCTTVSENVTGSTSSDTKIRTITESNLSDFSYGGIYKAALFENIATYPDEFLYTY